MDLILKNGRVVDPKNRINEVLDVGIMGDQIASVGHASPEWDGPEVDLRGKIVIPGVIDDHTHLAARKPDQFAAGLRDVVRMGTTTAIDFSGPVDALMQNAARYGTGINIGVLNAIRPTKEVPTRDPSRAEIEAFLDKSLQDGAIGLKILGGQHPCTPDATRRIIATANDAGVYVAFHFGTTANGSDFNGLREAISFGREGLRLHICHIGGALRALILDDVIEEAQQALGLLEGLENVVTESLLGEISCDGGKCSGGRPESNIVMTRMKMFGFPPTEDGIEQSILASRTLVLANRGGYNCWITGAEGVAEWRRQNTDTYIGYPINDRRIAFLCATTRGKDGRFIVDALASDGGALPRNYNILEGMALVRFTGLSIGELAYKVSYAPSRMLGLLNKGHLSPGADADITVIDEPTGLPYMSIVSGRIIMLEGVALGSGATFLVTEKGAGAAERSRVPYKVVAPSNGWLYNPKFADKVWQGLR